MLGHRGCRLGITYPEITEMQARAIFEAAVRASRRGIDVRPEIMIPLVATDREFRAPARDHRRRWPSRSWRRWAIAVPYLIGTMIELPRAALTADQIAAEAEFFSFGTNDLTQTTFGSQSRRCRALPAGLSRARDSRRRSVPGAGRARRRGTRLHGGRPPAAACGRTSRSASAASTAASHDRSASATASAWTTSPARRSACPSRGSRRRRQPWARGPSATDTMPGVTPCGAMARDAPAGGRRATHCVAPTRRFHTPRVQCLLVSFPGP